MADLTTTPPPKISCEVCRKEIPRSTAISEAGRDYLYYFCGADCYQRWIERRPPPDRPSR